MKAGKWLLCSIVVSVLCLVSTLSADNIWELQAVNADGNGTHLKVGADVTDPSNKVIVEGIALNSSDEYLNPNFMWQVYVQSETPDTSGNIGGIAAWAGTWFAPSWPYYTTPVNSGDRIRITGFVSDHRGKVNINSRHSDYPPQQFVVEVIEAGIGMPDPILIPDINSCNYFDETRAGGGELYQAQWCQLSDVWVQSGDWAPGKTVVLTDDSGGTLDMLLSSEGTFNTQPTGLFSVTGVFDQEDLGRLIDPDGPDDGPKYFTEKYRLWVKNDNAVVPEPATLVCLALGSVVLGLRRRRRPLK